VHNCPPRSLERSFYINIYKYFLCVCKYILYIFFLVLPDYIFIGSWLQNMHVTFSSVR